MYILHSWLYQERKMDLIKNMFGVIFLILFSVMISRLKVEAAGQLSYDFYERTCPQVEDIVRDGLQSLFLSDPTSAAALLRLMFHDCQVQGCDASILIDDSLYDGGSMAAAGEMGSSKNFGIRKRESISMVKSMVEAACPQQVSCADILILAARESIAMSGGPVIRVPLGRRDSSSLPTSQLADALLPPPDLGVDGMLRIFAQKGMTVEESVAIIGAHTLGITHCSNIFSRIYGQQFGKAADNMKPGFNLLLRLMCPQSQQSLTQALRFVINDPTSFIFDNQYYINALKGRGILRVDAELPSDPRTSPIVQRFASNQGHFFRAFSSAFLKLSSSSVLTGDQGVIRERCSII